jgi:two-component system, cell cycle sensor histidine kinase and response regulator CckA
MADGPPIESRVRLGRRYTLALAAALAAWIGLVGALVWLVYARTAWLEVADQAHLREWLDESRVVRKTLPDLAGEYVVLRESGLPDDDDAVVRKTEEIAEQLRALAEPTRMYQGFLPLFPDVYVLAVRFPNSDWPDIKWESPVPQPRRQNETTIDVLDYPLPNRYGDKAHLHCEYRLHAFNQRQREAAGRQQQQLLAIGLGVLALLPIAALGYWSLQRERRREFSRLRSVQQVEHATNVALQEKLARQGAERAREELDRKLLEQKLEAARQEGRAADAERAALELKSQLYASIGIMAGSYAHNIKNLLVRPNDLIARCLDADGLSGDQQSMLGEVRQTLGTVTERLQQILRTVRRDPSKAELSRIDLNALVREMQRSWTDLAREKWKLELTICPASEPLWIEGDPSHLQQAIENLLFNARDATFEMRNHLRESARQAPGVNEAGRRQALIDAAGWKGRINLQAIRAGDCAVLEVRDNGIGMTEEVRRLCTQTHFSTKRDNALYEGYNAGMGLGLSFTVVVLEHHHATLEIESQPLLGATFRVHFPIVNSTKESKTAG